MENTDQSGCSGIGPVRDEELQKRGSQEIEQMSLDERSGGGGGGGGGARGLMGRMVGPWERSV